MKTSLLIFTFVLLGFAQLAAFQDSSNGTAGKVKTHRGRKGSSSDGTRFRRKNKEFLNNGEIDRIHSAQRTWAAEIPSNFAGLSIEELQSLLSVLPPTQTAAPQGKEGFIASLDNAETNTPSTNKTKNIPTSEENESTVDPSTISNESPYAKKNPFGNENSTESSPSEPSTEDINSSKKNPYGNETDSSIDYSSKNPYGNETSPDLNSSEHIDPNAPSFEGETDSSEPPQNPENETKPSEEVPTEIPIPEYFDARDKWASCIGPVRNQKNCGSCWAMGTSITFEDRICIATNGKFTQMSPQFLIDCDTVQGGCNGGNPIKAWDFVKRVGLPSETCQPYKAVKKACPTTCVDGSPLDNIRVKATRSYSSIDDVKRDIMTYGPVATWMTIYEDFFYYKAGVYQRTSNVLEGFHAAKVIGWGTDPYYGDYWIAQNIWTTMWGEKGFFRIKANDGDFDVLSHFIAGYLDV